MAPLASPIYDDEAGMNPYICRYCRQPSDPGLPTSGWLYRDRNQCLDSGALLPQCQRVPPGCRGSDPVARKRMLRWKQLVRFSPAFRAVSSCDAPAADVNQVCGYDLQSGMSRHRQYG